MRVSPCVYILRGSGKMLYDNPISMATRYLIKSEISSRPALPEVHVYEIFSRGISRSFGCVYSVCL